MIRRPQSQWRYRALLTSSFLSRPKYILSVRALTKSFLYTWDFCSFIEMAIQVRVAFLFYKSNRFNNFGNFSV